MKYPNPDTSFKVRGPVQLVTDSSAPGGVRARRLYILTSRHGRHTTKIAPALRSARALTQDDQGAEAQ